MFILFILNPVDENEGISIDVDYQETFLRITPNANNFIANLYMCTIRNAHHFW